MSYAQKTHTTAKDSAKTVMKVVIRALALVAVIHAEKVKENKGIKRTHTAKNVPSVPPSIKENAMHVQSHAYNVLNLVSAKSVMILLL